MLVLALVTVMIISALLGATLMVTSTASRRQAEATGQAQAFYLAEAGLSEAYTALAMGKTGNIGSEDEPAAFGRGFIWTTAEDLGDDRVRLDSTALVGRGRAVLSLVAERSSATASSLGVFTTAPLTIPKGATVDGYNSRLGSYDSHVAQGLEATKTGSVGSNGDIVVESDSSNTTLVNGNVAYGPSSSVTITPDATVTGSSAPAPAVTVLPPVAPPSIPTVGGTTVERDSPLLLGPGSHGFDALEIKEGRMTIEGPAQVLVGDLFVDSKGLLQFDTSGGRVDLFVTESLEVPQGASIGGSNTDPTLVSIQVAGDVPVKFGPRKFFGTLYAPEASIETEGAFELFGSIVGRELVLNEGAELHFDLALLSQLIEDQVLPRLLSWRILEFGPENPSEAGRTAQELIGVDPAALPTLARAHADQMLDVTYIHTNGSTQSFSGMESAFDWSNVKSVTTLSRDGEPVVVGTAMAAAAAEPEPPGPSPADQALMDLFTQTPKLSSGDLKVALLDASPVSVDVLVYMVGLPFSQQEMSSGDIDNVLGANSPLPDDELRQVMQAIFDNPEPTLSSGDCKTILVANSPLPPSVKEGILLTMLTSPGSPMTSSDHTNVLEDNSPLPPSVLSLVTGGSTNLIPADITKVLLAQ